MTVPTPTIRRIVETILAHGRVRRGYLGVGAQPTPLPEKLAQELGQETGLLLVFVAPGSPAESGGMFLGDTIVSLAGQPVRRLDALLAGLGGEQISKQAPIRIVRGGQLQEITVTLVEHS